MYDVGWLTDWRKVSASAKFAFLNNRSRRPSDEQLKREKVVEYCTYTLCALIIQVDCEVFWKVFSPSLGALLCESLMNSVHPRNRWTHDSFRTMAVTMCIFTRVGVAFIVPRLIKISKRNSWKNSQYSGRKGPHRFAVIKDTASSNNGH